MYKTFIVDELNYILYDCSKLTERHIDNILKDHEEWSLKCLEVF